MQSVGETSLPSRSVTATVVSKTYRPTRVTERYQRRLAAKTTGRQARAAILAYPVGFQ
jgi:hypothetical protein